jgi:hypothetical protein
MHQGTDLGCASVIGALVEMIVDLPCAPFEFLRTPDGRNEVPFDVFDDGRHGRLPVRCTAALGRFGDGASGFALRNPHQSGNRASPFGRLC